MKKLYAFVAAPMGLIAASVMSGCVSGADNKSWCPYGAASEHQIIVEYTPTTTQKLAGSIGIGYFKYFSPQGIADNQVHEVACARYFLDRPLSTIFDKAVESEFRHAGVSVNDVSACTLGGVINVFMVDSLGFSSNFSADIEYIIYSKPGQIVMEKAYQTKFNASKFSGLESLDKNIRRLITENINALMTDRESLKAFERFCDITVDSKARTT